MTNEETKEAVVEETEVKTEEPKSVEATGENNEQDTTGDEDELSPWYYFFSQGCGWCKKSTPVVEELNKEGKLPELQKMAEGGIMNLGGMEMDLRGGGFVPLGAKEKADDVPARLSKNEFVMTADAVRAAGGGSIDKGADKMYNLMKDLEAKV